MRRDQWGKVGLSRKRFLISFGMTKEPNNTTDQWGKVGFLTEVRLYKSTREKRTPGGVLFQQILIVLVRVGTETSGCGINVRQSTKGAEIWIVYIVTIGNVSICPVVCGIRC